MIDLFRLAMGTFTNPHSYTKFRTIDMLRKTTKARTFVEAGTYLGVTAARAATVFERVYTIELSTVLAEQARLYLASRANVCIMEGDALSLLPSLLRKDEVRAAIMYLDSHPCGPRTAEGLLSEPAIEELKILAEHADQVNAIVVDDFRLFGVEQGFPTKSALLAAAEQLFGTKGFRVVVHLDQLVVTRV